MEKKKTKETVPPRTSGYEEKYLDKIGQEIRYQFITKMRAKNPSYQLLAKFDLDQTWAAAADRCLTLKLEPESFVDAVFSGLAKYIKIYPKHLLSVKISNPTQNYLQTFGCNDIKEYVDVKFKFANSLLRQPNENLPEGQRGLMIMRMPAYAIPAWLRLVLFPTDEIILERYKAEGLYELETMPGLLDELERRDIKNVRAIYESLKH